MFRVLPSCNKVFHNLNSLRFHYLTTDIIYSEIFLNNSLNVIENYKKSNFSSLTFNRSIELKDVNFSYSQSGLNVLSNVNIEIKKNQMTGICGPSGSGKNDRGETGGTRFITYYLIFFYEYHSFLHSTGDTAYL